MRGSSSLRRTPDPGWWAPLLPRTATTTRRCPAAASPGSAQFTSTSFQLAVGRCLQHGACRA
eukprot:7615288-Pyramimonas_sp.AAC.1